MVFVLGLCVMLLKASADVGSIITSSVFENMLKHRNDAACEGKGFYTYDAFITAAKAFPAFGTTGDATTQKRELAAFFGQTSHETTGGWSSAPDGPYAWGYCSVREGSNTASTGYYGRGPIQLTHDYNYRDAGSAIGADLINQPDLVATDAVISFKTAIWFWMTAQGNKPSSHDVITNRWTPSAADTSAGRVAGYGVITNIINGGLECGKGQNDQVADRIGFYKRYCDLFGVAYGDNLDCYNQQPFA
ncbi:basic endochitinase-like [Senna tora]|uniref:Basic endochitinase-like n=1 Tax=Senna tora TaxID=362788 RepID=A0A834WMN5_9FABA|nr:basic endochitinase-like [Senna tora]